MKRKIYKPSVRSNVSPFYVMDLLEKAKETELEGKKVEHGDLAECLKELQESIDDLKKERDDTSENIQVLTLKKEEEIDGDFKQLQQQEEDFSKALVKANTVWENSCNEFEKEKKEFATLEKSMEDNDAALEETKKEKRRRKDHYLFF